MLRLILVAAVVSVITAVPAPPIYQVERPPTEDSLLKDAKDIMIRFDRAFTKWSNAQNIAEWNYITNMTKENQKKRLAASMLPRPITEIRMEVNTFPWEDLEDEYVKRQFRKFIKEFVFFPIHETEDTVDSLENLQSAISNMEGSSHAVKICGYNRGKDRCDLGFREIRATMRYSRDPKTLKYVWVEWAKDLGDRIRLVYPKYVVNANIEARRKKYLDRAALWLSEYEADDLPEQVENLWQQLKPLYLQLHAYVRRELRKKYGENVVSKDGPIPAHLLEPDTWSNVANLTLPFPRKQIPDVTNALRKQGYSAYKIFRLAEHFFKSINLSAMTDKFWEKSILEKPRNAKLKSCLAESWDFYDGRDFRIKQCTHIDMENLFTTHHEMGHIEYYMQYKDQPALFRDSANPAFHEAVGDVISLSVSTPGYLKKIGLLENDSNDPKASINHLFLMSLDKVAHLPLAYIVDRWRWNVFQGKVTSDNYNCHWWSLAEKYQGIEPPVDRSEEDFDPGMQYHIVADIEFMRYYVGAVIQFQFHKALCIKARQYNPHYPDANPLHKCHIYGNKDAGNLLKSMMELGSSKPWPDAMEVITGQRKMDASALLEYFQPLMDWLTEENKKTNEYIGWKASNRRCVKTRQELIVRHDEISDEL